MLARRWLLNALLLILIATVSSQQWGPGKKKDNCPKPTLKNGKVKLRSNGRVVRYNCNRDYVLVGESTSTCLQGEWTTETPVCAAKGCPDLEPPPSGRFIKSNGGATMRLQCNPGYYPSDSPMLFCDRFEWNGTAPLCQVSAEKPEMRCEFETDDLCGWSQDANDEFDWTWQGGATPSSHLNTGPSFDHTLGAGKNGHYLFIESSSPRLPNDTARLYSPVYSPPEPAAEGGGSCFTFWYHMYGSTTGLLNVYIKTENVNMKYVKPSFSKSGDQGNQWHQGYIALDNLTENFQVVIEGVRGIAYSGDSAIDDVWLTDGRNCIEALDRMRAETPSAPRVDPSTGLVSSTLPPSASCFSRCSSTLASAAAEDGFASTSSSCGCNDECLLTGSCCIDYATYCLAGTSTTPVIMTSTETAGGEGTGQESATVLMTNSTESAPTSSSEIFSTSGTTSEMPPTTSSTTPTTASSTTFSTSLSTISVTSTTTYAPSTTMPTSTPSTSAEVMTTSSNTLPTRIPSTSPSTSPSSTVCTESTTKATETTGTLTTLPLSTITTTPTAPSVNTISHAATAVTKTPVRPSPSTPSTITTTVTSTSTIPPSTARSTTTAMPSSIIVPTTSTTMRALTTKTTDRTPSFVTQQSSTATFSHSPSTPTDSPTRPTTLKDGVQGDQSPPGASRINENTSGPNSGRNRSDSGRSNGIVIGAVAGGVTGALLLAGLAVFIIRARRAKIGINDRGRPQEFLAEDSDVRYLRDEDEVQLDLTEATPSPPSSASAGSSGTRSRFINFDQL